jgi:hypothetical protein
MGDEPRVFSPGSVDFPDPEHPYAPVPALSAPLLRVVSSQLIDQVQRSLRHARPGPHPMAHRRRAHGSQG